MKVSLAPHGGQAAGVFLNRPARSVAVEDLAPAQAAELARLVQAVKDAPAPAAPSEPRPDAASYTITIEEGGRRTELKQSDTTMTSEFGALLGWLNKHFAKPP